MTLRHDDRPSACRVFPFGHPRINGHLHLNAAFRSLSRPSSPVRAQASSVRPFLLLLHDASPLASATGRAIYFRLYFLFLITFACCIHVSQYVIDRSPIFLLG